MNRAVARSSSAWALKSQTRTLLMAYHPEQTTLNFNRAKMEKPTQGPTVSRMNYLLISPSSTKGQGRNLNENVGDAGGEGKCDEQGPRASMDQPHSSEGWPALLSPGG
jgi:hypothetical protein